MMRAARFITTVFATGFVAFAAGHIVENGEATASRIGASLQSPGMARASVLPGVPRLPRPPIETLQAIPLPATRGWMPEQPKSFGLAALDRTRFSSDPNQTCDASLTATSAPGGMIRISLVAPCSIQEPVTFRHEGLSFTELTNETGRMTIEVPALTANVAIEAVMQNGHAVRAQTLVPDAEDFQRVALVWRGETGLHIHAQEFGAQMGATGHIWAGSPGRADLGPNAKGGYLSTFGDRTLTNATHAEIYTFPENTANNSGVVRLTVQAEVRNTNCGGIVAAKSLQPDGFGSVISSDLTLRLPECDKIGEHLVLKNILRDLKIASN